MEVAKKYIISIKSGWTSTYSTQQKTLTESELNAYCKKVSESGSKIIGIHEDTTN